MPEIDKKWTEIFASRQSGKILTGVLTAVENYKLQDKATDCGVVFYDGVKVIIPVSEMGIPEEWSIMRSIVGAEIDFIVRGIDVENEIAVASRKSAMELRKNLEFHKHKAGEKILIRIFAIGKKWLYAEVYGVEIKINKEDVAYGYIDDLTEFVQVGQKVPAIIKEIDPENFTVKVSIKEATKDPFKEIENKYRVSGEYMAQITGIKPFGIFVELEQGIYALCNHPNWIGYRPYKGDIVLVKIKSINIDSRKVNATLIRTIRSQKALYM